MSAPDGRQEAHCLGPSNRLDDLRRRLALGQFYPSFSSTTQKSPCQSNRSTRLIGIRLVNPHPVRTRTSAGVTDTPAIALPRRRNRGASSSSRSTISPKLAALPPGSCARIAESESMADRST